MQKTALLVLSRQFFKQSKSRILLSGIWMAFLLLPLTAFSQDLGTVKINLDIHNVPLKEAFAEMQKLSSIKFVYGEDVNTYASARVSITDENISLKDALTRTLNGTNLRYTQKGDHVMIDEKPGAQHSTPQPKGQGGSGTLKGRVVEAETSEPLPGASVVLVGGKLATSTNVDGYYQFDRVPSGEYMIEVSYMGFKKEQIKVQVAASKTATYDVKLAGDATALDEVTVSAVRKQRGSVPHMTEKMLTQEIKALSVVASGISSEQISKSADRNAADVVQKIAGVSTRENKYVVVRGMNERYNLTYLNDNVAPSTEVYSRAFALDLLPTRIIDRIVVYKSPSPELLGDMTGGAVKIYTKDANIVKHFDISLQVGARENTTFKDIMTYKGGKYDFLGFDDGIRALPKTVSKYGDFTKTTISQKQYAESFNSSLTYGKVTALPDMQLTANYYDAFPIFGKTLSTLTSFSYKKESYRNTANRMEGFTTSGQGIKELDKMTLEDNSQANAQLSLLQNFAYKLNDRHRIQFKNFLLQQGQDLTSIKTGGSGYYLNTATEEWVQEPSREKRTKNIVYSYTQRFLYSGNLSGSHSLGKDDRHKLEWNGGYIFTRQEMPDQRVLRFDNASYGSLYSEDLFPDYSYNWMAVPREQTREGGSYNALELGKISRQWTRNTEQVGNVSLDYKFSVNDWITLNAGTYNQVKERVLYRKVFTLNEGDLGSSGYPSGTSWLIGATADYMDYSKVFYRETDLYKVWSTDYIRDDGSALKVYDRTSGSDSYKAYERLHSGYVSAKLTPFGEKLDLSGGVRVEYDRQRISSAVASKSGGGINQPIYVNNNTTDYLPSVNASYKPNDKWVLRAAYGKTLNRPEFREAASFREMDYMNNTYIVGNSDLTASSAANYDFRTEWYFSGNNSSDMLSVGAFYKDIDSPIERIITRDMDNSGITNPTISYYNAKDATIKGIEVELHKDFSFIPLAFFRNLSFIGNFSYMHSEATIPNKQIFPPDGEYGKLYYDYISRKLQGQAPYILNAGLYYDNANMGSKVAFIFNAIGERIYAASRGSVGQMNSGSAPTKGYLGSQIELPNRQLDFSFTQRINKGWQIKFAIQNLLDAEWQIAEDGNFTYKYEELKDGSGDIITNYRKPGRFYSFNFTYSF